MTKIIIAGDFCPRERVQKLIKAKNYETIFCDVKKRIAESNYSIVNFEAPVVPQNALAIKKCGPNLKCTHEAVEAIRYAGFNMVTLANNHFYDYGDSGVSETIRSCKSLGIETIGGGRNITEAAQTIYKNINGETFAFINCCEHEFSIAADHKGGSNPLNAIKQYYEIKKAKEKAKWTIIIVHGGHEHYNLPSPRMKETYRFFIDAGADAVINHHQHCYSGYEIYKSKPIFYGIGNFCFDRANQRNSIWNSGYMAELLLGDGRVSFNLVPYIQGGEAPGVKVLSKQQEIESFMKNITELNAVIADDSMLLQRHEDFMKKTQKYFLSMAEPYTNRYMRALYVRGLLPSKMSNKRCTELLNHVICESHLERFIYALKNK